MCYDDGETLKMRCQFRRVQGLCVRSRREIFALLRRSGGDGRDVYFPSYGLSGGTFALLQLLVESDKRKERPCRRRTKERGLTKE